MFSSAENVKRYTGNGVTTAFAFDKLFYDEDHLDVYLDDTLQTSGYTVTGAADPTGGTVTFSVAPSNGVVVTIERVVPYIQDTDFVNFDGNPSDVIEKQFDLIAMMAQQNNRAVSGSLTFPVTVDAVGSLPEPQDGYLLAWDGTTGDVKNVTPADLSGNVDTLFSTLATGDFLTYDGSAWENTAKDSLVIDGVQTSGSSGTGFKNSGGTTVMTVGPANTTNVSIAGGLTLGTALQVSSGGTGGSTAAAGFASLAGAFFTDKVIRGLELSNNVTDATNDIDIAAGVCVSDDGTTVMNLSAITKRLDATWTVGTNQGGLDTGAIADTTYHVWVIHRTDTGVTDVLFSTSASSPTMPTSYTKKKCIGSIIRSSGAILAFTQVKNRFYLSTPIITGTATNPGTSAVTRATGCPTGAKFIALLQACIYPSTTGFGWYISSLDSADVAPQAPGTASLTAPGVATDANGGSFWQFNYNEVLTNTSAEIRTRASASGAADRVGLVTSGWIDLRI